jgi:hypothetical protein
MTTETSESSTVDAKRMAVVALVLILGGVTILTVGITLAFGVPAGLIALGGLLIAGGVLLGLT